MKRLLLLCGLVALFAASSAFGGASRSFSIDQTNVAYGDMVTFSYSGYNATVITVQCNTTATNVGVYSAAKVVGSSFLLASSPDTGAWDGSSAICYAALTAHRQIVAQVTFQVSGS